MADNLVVYPYAVRFFLVAQNNWPFLDTAGQFFSIILLTALIGLMAYVSLRLLGGAGLGGSRLAARGLARNLQTIENLGVGVQSAVTLVRAGEKYLLLGVTKERITLLTELDKADLHLPEGKGPVQSKFDAALQRLLKRGSTDEKSGKDPDDEA